MSVVLLTILILALPIVSLYVLRLWKPQRASLPPGPRKHWLLGHLLVIPQFNADKAFYEWSKLYGESLSVLA